MAEQQQMQREEDRLARQEWLLGEESSRVLRRAHVAVFGIGGVGSYAVEALARSGVGRLTLVDRDVYSITNLNRQLYATRTTLGMAKTEAARQHIADIDPTVEVVCRNVFFLPETAGEFDFSEYDYVIDAVDTVAAKVALIEACHAAGTPILCAMGAGNKLDPTQFRVADIYKTDTCPLARAVRAACKARGIPHLRVVYSPEKPTLPPATAGEHPSPGSCAFVPSVMGLILAGEAVKALLSGKKAR